MSAIRTLLLGGFRIAGDWAAKPLPSSDRPNRPRIRSGSPGAHQHCRDNREELSRSALCGSFYCLAVYAPTQIAGWVDEERTALCDKCGIDSVIAEASGFPLTSEFLQRMHDHWF